jgi:benzoyl-CoA-dihydrodiol lyase
MAEGVETPVSFEVQPYGWTHWQLAIDGEVATLRMSVNEDRGLRPGYELKLNSYDLGVDIELYDVVERLRFEHPAVKVIVVTSATDRVFCAGANIRMLAQSTHAFKVNFCKFTNETRCSLEEPEGPRVIAAVNGACAGGGYELALACHEIYLVDDGSSAVSLPEVPLLGVLPGTGGLTRLTDKRKVRRDLADLFCTKAEGFKARDALKGRFVDGTFPRSRWADGVKSVAQKAVAKVQGGAALGAKGVTLNPLKISAVKGGLAGEHVSVTFDDAGRTATLTVKGPTAAPPATHEALLALGDGAWSIAAFRELERIIFELRFNHPTLGLLLIQTEGDQAQVLAWDEALASLAAEGSWLATQTICLQRRTLRRVDNMSRSMYAVLRPGHAFAGVLFELAVAADRSFMLADDDGKNCLRLGSANFGRFPMMNGRTRLEVRFYGEPEKVAELEAIDEAITAEDAAEHGLVTTAPDEIDWDDELRISVEERASLSPDALTGMEQNLRFVGAESCDTRIFGRLTAWQNWIFQRPNAVGAQGALTLYGHPERPTFDYKRT